MTTALIVLLIWIFGGLLICYPIGRRLHRLNDEMDK